MFPIAAAFLENAQHEGIFRIRETAVRGQSLVLERDDIELLALRYLPAYLPTESLRAAVAARPALRERLDHGPVHPTEDPATAASHATYAASPLFQAAADQSCPRNFKLPKVPVARTPHTFLLLAEQDTGEDGGTVLAVHLYDRAPHNHQTALLLRLDASQLAAVRAARRVGGPLLFQTVQDTAEGPVESAFCMARIREQLAAGQPLLRGTLRAGGRLAPFDAGQPQGLLSLSASAVTVLVNRELPSLLDPHAVVGP